MRCIGRSCPVDIYVALYAPQLSSEIYVFGTDGALHPLSKGLVPWKQGMMKPIDQKLVGDILLANIPYATYHFYVLAMPSNGKGSYVIWHTQLNHPKITVLPLIH